LKDAKIKGAVKMGEPSFSLEGKIALITGGSRGIGRSIAHAFARQGADMALCSRKLPALEEVADEIKELGRRALTISAHMGRPDEIENAVTQTEDELGPIDILVNNAATNPIFGPVLYSTIEAWDKIMEVNLRGCYLMSMAAGKRMMERQGGIIINVASTAGRSPMPGLGIYSVSKAGVIMLTKVLAWEWAAFNIRVNTIAPGMVETRFSKAIWETPELLEEVRKHTPMGRISQPDEIAGAAVYLASDASSFVTGETIVLDGGAGIGAGS